MLGSPVTAPRPACGASRARIVLGRMAGGYTDAFEIICCDCGDRPYWDYSEISFQLQRIRGPYALDAGIAAYEQHLGLAT